MFRFRAFLSETEPVSDILFADTYEQLVEDVEEIFGIYRDAYILLLGPICPIEFESEEV